MRTGFGTNNVDHCTRLCHASSVAALLEGVGSGAVSASFNECKNSEVIIVIGANPTENHPVAATFFKQAAKRGAKLVIMDPRGTAMKRHAWKMMQFKNGADVAMLNAMLNVIVTEKLYDQQYIQTYVEGFDAWKENIKDFTPEEMEPICGIPADTLREVARAYARAESSIIFWGMGVSQHTHGTDNARCLIALALITGQIGRPGTGLHPLRGQNNVQGASDAGLIPMFFPDYKSVENPEIRAKYESAWGVKLPPKKGKTVVEIMDAVHADEIKGMYVEGENPAMSDPDLNHARQALAHLEHLVVQDLFLTETAMYADVVLPASGWPEKDGTVTNTNRQVQIGRAALPLPGDTRQDLWIIQDIANRMGCGWNYKHVSEVFTEMASMMPALANISWDRVERENSVTYPTDGPTFRAIPMQPGGSLRQEARRRPSVRWWICHRERRPRGLRRYWCRAYQHDPEAHRWIARYFHVGPPAAPWSVPADCIRRVHARRHTSGSAIDSRPSRPFHVAPRVADKCSDAGTGGLQRGGA